MRGSARKRAKKCRNERVSVNMLSTRVSTEIGQSGRVAVVGDNPVTFAVY
jgi:hypothetical protein